jgi:hypothetical protein
MSSGTSTANIDAQIVFKSRRSIPEGLLESLSLDEVDTLKAVARFMKSDKPGAMTIHKNSEGKPSKIHVNLIYELSEISQAIF